MSTLDEPRFPAPSGAIFAFRKKDLESEIAIPRGEIRVESHASELDFGLGTNWADGCRGMVPISALIGISERAGKAASLRRGWVR